MEVYELDGKKMIDARELYQWLGIKKDFSDWVKHNISRAMLDESDFTPYKGKSSGGRPTKEYHLTKDAAMAFIMLSGGENAYNVRKQVIDLFNKHDTGLAFTAEQINALIDLSKSMCLVSIQKEVERKHFSIYNDKYTWYQYRAGLLGYSTDTLIQAMKTVNKQHKSIRKSLVQLDANELIRTGVIDFMKAMGKTDQYAQNVGQLCKDMAEKMELGNHIWDDTKDDPIGIQKGFVNERKQLFNKTKQLKD